MKIKFLLALFVAVISGCTTVQDLQKIDSKRHFVLHCDYVRSETRGIGGALWIEGLLAGHYVEFAEDDDSTYFVGDGHSVILLFEDAAREYRRTKKVKPGPYMFGSAKGGLWLPKPGVDEEPKLFYTIQQSTNGSSLGPVVVSISNSLEGSLDFVPFGTESRFIEGLKIVED